MSQPVPASTKCSKKKADGAGDRHHITLKRGSTHKDNIQYIWNLPGRRH